MNIQFNYLYRDGSNYKQFHYEVFSNNIELSIEEIEHVIKKTLITETWFYTQEWQLNDIRQDWWDDFEDPSWHEYESIQLTEKPATKGDIKEFLELISVFQSDF